MKIFFTHTHQFLLYKNDYYSTGGITNEVVNRYATFCKNLIFGVRVKQVSNLDSKKLSKVSNEKLEFLKLNYNFQLFSNIKKTVLESDIVIARLPSLFGLVAIYYAKKYDKKVLCEVVGNAFDALWYHSWKGKLSAMPLELLTKQAVKASDYISYITVDYLQSKYPSNGRVCSGLANITIQDANFKNNEVLKARLASIDSNSILKLGLIGNYEIKYKGQREALFVFSEVLKQYPCLKLELVGGGNSKTLKALVSKLKIEHAVSMPGTIPNEEINKWLDTVDIYLQPSKTEGHGRSVIEAMSRGCAVVASNIGGMKETVEKNCRFNLGNRSEFIQILTSIISNSNLRKKLAERNYNTSKAFKNSYISEKRTSFYKEIFRNQ